MHQFITWILTLDISDIVSAILCTYGAIYFSVSLVQKRFQYRETWAKWSVLILCLSLLFLSALTFALDFKFLPSSAFKLLNLEGVKSVTIGFVVGVLFVLLISGQLIRLKKRAEQDAAANP